MRGSLLLLLAGPCAAAVLRGPASVPTSAAQASLAAVQIPFPDGQAVFPAPWTVWWTPAQAAAQAADPARVPAAAPEPTPAAEPAAAAAAVPAAGVVDAGEQRIATIGAVERLAARAPLSAADRKALEDAAEAAYRRKDVLSIARIGLLAVHDVGLRGAVSRILKRMAMNDDARSALATIDRASGGGLDDGARSFMAGELRKVFDGSR